MEPWLTDLRAAFDNVFDLDWSTHIAGLNATHHLTGGNTLATGSHPPEFFWGDLEHFTPREWVAVISLNPQMPSEKDEAWYVRQKWSAESYWQYLNRRDFRNEPEEDYYYSTFARPLVKLTGGALGIPNPTDDPVPILMRRMALFEILPYPSKTYVPRPETAVSLVTSDPGCALSSKIARGVIEHARPRIVLVNGNDALAVFDAVWRPRWTEQRYASASRATKTLRHWEGAIDAGGREVPVVGFPQLRTRGGHNSNAEVEQLAARIAELANPT